VTTLLAPLPRLLAPLVAPAAGSPAAEIRLRAEHLAESQNAVLSSARRARGRSHRAGLGVRVGGEEEVGRASHDTPRRSLSLDAEEKMRRGVAELLARARGRRIPADKGGGDAPAAEGEAAKEEDLLPPVPGLPSVRAAYLLVSPPVGVATALATMSFSVPFLRRAKQRPAAAEEAADEAGDADAERKLAAHPTLAIYGDGDGFSSSKKVREWAARLSGAPGSLFRAHEVSTAGHFWAEGRTVYVLRDAVAAFGTELLNGAGGGQV